MSREHHTGRHPFTDTPPTGAPRVIDLRDGADPREGTALPLALLREAYEERLLLLTGGAGQDDLDANALRVRELEAALRPTRRLPRRTLEPSIFLG